MDSVFAIVLVVGYLISIVGGFMVLFAAFRESALWGLACIFIPFASLVFLIKFWDAGKRGFFVSLAGLAVCVVGGAGLFIATDATATSGETQTAAAVTQPVGPTPWNEPEPAARSSVWNDTAQTTEPAGSIALASTRVQQTSMVLEPGEPPLQSAQPPQPIGFARPRTPAVARVNPIEKVWADRSTHLYYTEDCGTHPAGAFRIAKSAAVVQDFQPAPCV
ncbi:MAG: hypothetical protein ACYC7A_04260 [Thermoanaerobaculia bacterium]